MRRWKSSGNASSALPVHQRRPTERRVVFEDTQPASWKSLFWKAFSKVRHNLVSASTGSISDGLTDALSGPSDEGSTTTAAFNPAASEKAQQQQDDEDWSVDEVVVNGEESTHAGLLGSEKDTTTRQSPSDTASTRHGQGPGEQEGPAVPYGTGFFYYLRWTVWPLVYGFFEPTFEDPEQEQEFQKSVWFSTKRLTFYASLYLYLNWVLYLILNHSVSLYEKIVYYGGLSLVTLPIPFLIAMDVPRKHPRLFQIAFCTAVWYCGVTELIQMKQCHFFIDRKDCGKKDFLATMFYNSALPMLAMFIITKRFHNFVIQLVVIILEIGLLIPNQGIYWRNVVSLGIFYLFMQFIHYTKEMSERRMYLLSQQLKAAYRRQQKAQMAESKASNAKRRFASYIFHEVRVPLNTCTLAYQNLEPVFKSVIERNNGEQAIEVDAMLSSLHMMQTVLNDALDLDRMDAGRFECSPRPFPLHRTIQYILRHTAVATAQKRLHLILDLDPEIDQVPCTPSADELWVIGDDVRLRQIISNLASNAVKFSTEGGEVKVLTKLLNPLPRRESDSVAIGSGGSNRDSPFPGGKDEQSPLIGEHNNSMLVFRLEVHDCGPGIKPSDLASTRLFQPFGQTDVGKATGKGSGLGLAIVRQIVHLSGGRLGIQSRKGRGATFWVEMVYPIATDAALRNNSQNSYNSHYNSAPLAPTVLARPRTTLAPVPDGSILTTPAEPSQLSLRSGDSKTLNDFNAITEAGAPFGYRANSSQIPLLVSDISPFPSPSLLRGESYSTEASILTSGKTPTGSPDVSPNMTIESPTIVEEPLRILVVDDDHLTRTLMTRMLTKLGCIVDVASDGKQCIDMVVGPTPTGEPPKEYDLISLDNHMPVMTGVQAVKHLRSLGRTDYVVGCTGNALSEDQASYRAAGADVILTKPIMLNQLKGAMQTARERRRARARSSISESRNGSPPREDIIYPPKPIHKHQPVITSD